MRRYLDGWAGVLALVFAALTVVGTSFLSDNSAAAIASSAGAVVGAILATIGLAVLLYLGLIILFRATDRAARTSEVAGDSISAGASGLRAMLRRHAVPTWATVFGGWAVWLVVHYPGAIDSDTMTQRLQWMGLQRQTDHHPWFDTMVFGWFWDLGAALGNDQIGLFTYVVMQAAALAAGISLGLCYLARLGVPAVVRWSLTMVAAVFPTIVMAPAVMSKDALSSVFWLPFLVIFAECVRTRAGILRRPSIVIGFGVIATLLVLTKRTNIYLVVISLIVLMIVTTWRRWLPIVGVGVGVVALTIGVWSGVVLPSVGIAPGSETDIFSLPVQQTARITQAHGDEIPEHERDAIDVVLRWDGLGDAYVPRRSDSVKGRWNVEATTQQKLDYLAVWLAQGLRYPETAISATLANTFEYFAPLTPVTYQDDLNIDHYVDFWTSRSLPTTDRAEVQEIADRLQVPVLTDGVRESVNSVTTTIIEATPLASKAIVASWIPLTLLVIALRRRNGFLAVVTAPVMVQLLFLIASPVALPRYLVPMVFASVFAIGLMFSSATWEGRSSRRGDVRYTGSVVESHIGRKGE